MDADEKRPDGWFASGAARGSTAHLFIDGRAVCQDDERLTADWWRAARGEAVCCINCQIGDPR